MATDDWTKDPAELPEDGERYDMTLDKIGVNKIGPKDNKEEVVVVKAIIDNGEYEGKRVSTIFRHTEIMNDSSRWTAFNKATQTSARYHSKSLKEFLAPFKEAEKEARFSAKVHVREFEDDSKRGVKYDLSGFDTPETQADLHLRSEPTQFIR